MNSDTLPDWFSAGNTTSMNITMPRPPTHCVRARQNRMPWLSDSTSAKTVAPVVVKPDMVSKNASVTLSGEGMNRNGTMPMSE